MVHLLLLSYDYYIIVIIYIRWITVPVRIAFRVCPPKRTSAPRSRGHRQWMFSSPSGISGSSMSTAEIHRNQLGRSILPLESAAGIGWLSFKLQTGLNLVDLHSLMLNPQFMCTFYRADMQVVWKWIHPRRIDSILHVLTGGGGTKSRFAAGRFAQLSSRGGSDSTCQGGCFWVFPWEIWIEMAMDSHGDSIEFIYIESCVG